MDIAIVMFALIVTLSRAGISSLALNDVENVNDYSNTDAPIETKGFKKNVNQAKDLLMQLVPMGNIEEIEKFGKREIEQSNKLASLSRKARCKFLRNSWRSRKAKKVWGVSRTPLKHITAPRSTSDNGGTENSFKKPAIRPAPVARAREPTNNFDNPKTTKRENEHGVGEIVMLPPQTVDSVVVISEGAKTASNETPKSYVCGTFDEKDKQRPAAEPMRIGIPLNSARETDNPHYERNGSFQEIFQNFPLNENQMTTDPRQPFGINQDVPFPNLGPDFAQEHISHPSYAGKSTYHDTLVDNAMSQNNRNVDEPFADGEDSLSDEDDVIKTPMNNLELDDCIRNYGLEHCIPVPGELRSYGQNHQSEAYDQRPITSFHSVHANPLTEQPDNDLEVHVPTTAEEETAAESDEDDISTPENVHGQNFDYSSIYEDTDETEKPQDSTNESKENKVTTSLPGATKVPKIDEHEENSDGSEESSTKPYDRAGERNQVIGSGGSPEDGSADDELKSSTSIPDSPEDKSSSRMATAPGDRKLYDLPASAANILREKKPEDYGLMDTPLTDDDDHSEEITPSHVNPTTNITNDVIPGNATSFRTAALATSLQEESSTNQPRTSDEVVLARRLLLIPKVQHLALQDTKLLLPDLEDLSTFGLSIAQVADETILTFLKNVADNLSTAIETLPDKNLKQYIKQLLHYYGLTAEGVQSEDTKKLLFRTIKRTLKNSGFKVNNAHIWDTLKTVISQTRLPRTSMIRSTDMPEVGFKRLPFIPVKERVFKDGHWVEKSSLLGGSRDRFEPKFRKAQSKKFHSEFTTEPMDQMLLADSGKASSKELKAILNDVVESTGEKSAPAASSEFVPNEEENEKMPIKYYSPASRLLAYRKKIQVPKVMFQLEEKTRVSPRTSRLSPVADSSIPVNSTDHKLPPATEIELKFRKKPDSLGKDLHDDHEEFHVTTRSETGLKTIRAEDPAEQRTEQSKLSESSSDAARNSKRGTVYQQIPNKQMIETQEQVSNHEQSSLMDRSSSATQEYDPTYFGKISLTSAKSPPGKMSDLTDTDLFYIGDGVKIPLKLKRMSDGSWGLSISEKICENFVKQKCPCNIPNEGDIVEEKRRQKKNTSSPENPGLRPIPKNNFPLGGFKSSISDVDEPKERRTRSFLETDLHTTSSSPATKFVEKYNLTLNPKNISNSSGPKQTSATLNNNTEIIESMKNEKSFGTTPDAECNENSKRTINDVNPENQHPLNYDHDVTESSKNSNVADDENSTAVPGSNEDQINDTPKNEDNVSRNSIDHSINSTNVRGLRSMMENQDNSIDPNVLNLYDVAEREHGNIMGNPTTNEMNSHFAENPSHPMSFRSLEQPEPSKIDNVFEAENDDIVDRWSWVRDFVDSRRKHNVVMSSQDMDEAILLKIDKMFEAENAKVAKNTIDTAGDSNSAQNVASTINGSKFPDPVKNLNRMLDDGKMAERIFRKIENSRQTQNPEFGVNSIDSSKEFQLVRNSRPEVKRQDTDEPNQETLSEKNKMKERDDHNFFRITNVKAKSDYRRDNRILKRTGLVNRKQKNARPYRYQQHIDEEAQERMDVMTSVLYWLKEVFFEPSAESDD